MTTHLSDEQINDLIDGRLGAESIPAQHHLSECGDCERETSRIASVVTAARELRQPVTPRADIWPRIARQTIEASARRWSFRRRMDLPFAVIVMAGVVWWAAGNWASWTSPEDDLTQIRSELQQISAGRSDHDKAIRLRALAPRVLKRDDAGLDRELFSAVATISSDGERRTVLLDLAGRATGDSMAALLILESARSIQSSNAKADVLVYLANERMITTPRLRAKYLDVLATIKSQGAQNRARSALPGG